MTSFVLHKYYVSICEIVYNSDSKQLELSLKVFNDDWQNALEKRLGKPVNLGSPNEYDNVDSLEFSYLQDNIKILVDDREVHLKYLGSEIDGESTWIYMFVESVDEINSIEVQYKILTEVFEEQRNVLQLKVGEKNKSALLTKSRNTKKFILN